MCYFRQLFVWSLPIISNYYYFQVSRSLFDFVTIVWLSIFPFPYTGLGFYHSGVVVGCKEFTFASGAGIFDHSPKDAPGAVYRETIEYGYCEYTSSQIGSRLLSSFVCINTLMNVHKLISFFDISNNLQYSCVILTNFRYYDIRVAKRFSRQCIQHYEQEL